MAELKIGLVGTGAIGRTHIERINNSLQGGRVVACADVNFDFCKSVAEKYGIYAFASGEEMIASDEVEAVICTTADQPSRLASRYSARSRWHLRLRHASAS